LKPLLKAREFKCSQHLKQSQSTCCHSPDAWGTGSASQPTDQQIDPLSLALFSITSKLSHGLSYSKQFTDPTANALLLQTKKEVAGTGFSCMKHGLALPLFSMGRARKAQQREHCQKPQPQRRKRY